MRFNFFLFDANLMESKLFFVRCDAAEEKCERFTSEEFLRLNVKNARGEILENIAQVFARRLGMCWWRAEHVIKMKTKAA